ncbi:hypothetical protein C8D70_12316 [Chryseobacterium sp. CBTAP 102]|uniref:hypothetical protein n=1 Tax=Chryseobacterium sp. CBTAP 102 TaxID=2135644 RepID=UPI000D76B978|nr:hypothetical protein [Chryseobacterium sp. CBTAP 102]PXW07101.1 hypothetical protein C8D70_12316 [Chryseobacterium sp. CBTAP 102]
MKNIKVSEETKELLDDLSTRFNLKTYDNTVRTCSLFILRNEINLREDYIGDYRKGLVDLENRIFSKFKEHEDKILKSYASMRNWVGGIEKDHLKPLTAKLEILDKISNYEIHKIAEDKLNNVKSENPLNFNLPKPEEVKKNDFEEEKKEGVFEPDVPSNIEEKSQDNSTNSDLLNRYKEALQKIIFNSEIKEVETMLGKKKSIVVNLPLEEWNYINSLI